jgi:hypothetical protein
MYRSKFLILKALDRSRSETINLTLKSPVMHMTLRNKIERRKILTIRLVIVQSIATAKAHFVSELMSGLDLRPRFSKNFVDIPKITEEPGKITSLPLNGKGFICEQKNVTVSIGFPFFTSHKDSFNEWFRQDREFQIPEKLCQQNASSFP